MSRNEWEEGTIRIPSAQWAGFKATLQTAATAHAQRLYDESQVFWKSLPSRAKNNSKLYRQWVSAYLWGNVPNSNYNHYDPAIPTMQPRFRLDQWGDGPEGEFSSELRWLLERPLRHYVEGKGMVEEKPRRVLRADLKFPTNKTTSYEAGNGHISLDPKTRTVRWSAEGNHGCESAREHPMGQVFFKALDAVRWTRGSGGDIIGNDEYASEAKYEGGGANYSTGSYGPKTKSKRPVRYY